MPVSGYEIQASRAGVPTLKLGERWLHSQYDPAKEALREVEPVAAKKPAMVIVLGMGLGYAIDALRELLPDARILVIEADEEIYRLARAARPLPEGEHIVYVVGRNEEANFAAITAEMNEVAASSYQYVPRLSDLDGAYYGRVVETIGRIASMHIEGLCSTVLFGMLWWENAVRNYRAYAELPDVGSWFGAFRGVPLFIFAAGPTLNDDLDAFQGYEGGIRFAVDTSWYTVRSAGVRVDAVFAIDAQEKTLEHFARLGPDRLVAVPVVPPRLLAQSPRSMLTSYAGPLFEWFDTAMDRPLARLKSGGSVTTFAFDLARRMGADPIVLVGADFAHRSGRRYASETIYDTGALRSAHRFDSMETLQNRLARRAHRHETGVLTEENLRQYAQWLEWEIEQTRSRVYRLRDFGLLKKTPVLSRENFRKLLESPKPAVGWPEPRGLDPRRLIEAMRVERVTLDAALEGESAAVRQLSGFFDPIVRPSAVVSQKQRLSTEEMAELMRKLAHARDVMDELIADAQR